MGRDLIKRYSIEKLSLKDASRFLRDVYRSGKLREFISFIVWEVFHRLGLFSSKKYLKFNQGDVLRLHKGDALDSAFEENLNQRLHQHGLKAVKSAHLWKRLFIGNDGEIFGTLGSDSRELYKSLDHNASVDLVHTFSGKIKSIFISSRNNIFIAAGGVVYRGNVNGDLFEKVFDLSSPVSFFRHNYAMTETADGLLIVGEYGNVWENDNWRAIANLYLSPDDGRTWEKTDFLIKKGINKHVHIVRYSRNLNRLFLTDGDNYKKLWLSDPVSDASSAGSITWKPITRIHIQTGGYTSIAESNGKIMFGTDYQGGTNFIIETQDGKTYTKKVVPDPYRRSPIHSLVPRQTENGDQIWANLPISTGKSRSLVMLTDDGGTTWTKLIDYDSRKHAVSLLSAAKTAVDDMYIAFKDLRTNDRLVYRISNNFLPL
jgi:photosystem II stability/assembly factor-like uncharacterized protein